jgi:hypothetical protein
LINARATQAQPLNQGRGASGFSGTKEPLMVPLGLSASEKSDLVSFMRALTGDPIPDALRRHVRTLRSQGRDAEAPDLADGVSSSEVRSIGANHPVDCTVVAENAITAYDLMRPLADFEVAIHDIDTIVIRDEMGWVAETGQGSDPPETWHAPRATFSQGRVTARSKKARGPASCETGPG